MNKKQQRRKHERRKHHANEGQLRTKKRIRINTDVLAEIKAEARKKRKSFAKCMQARGYVEHEGVWYKERYA